MEAKNQILEGAKELFMRYGIKSITMDDIARHLSMSKKTIYEYHKDKDALVLEVTLSEMNEQKCGIDLISNNSVDVIEEMLKLSEYMQQTVSRINPALLFDLRKYHHKAWKEFQTHKMVNIGKSIYESMQKGIEQGYFRKDLNLDILVLLRLEQIEMMFNPEIYPHDKYNIADLSMNLFNHFIYGISTLKGHKKLNELKLIED